MKKEKIIKLLPLLGLMAGIIILFNGKESFAMEDSEIVNIIIKNSSLFTENSIGGSVLRIIGWGATKLLTAFATAAAGLFDTCFGFVDFTKYGPVNTFLSQWKPVFIALMCLSLLFVGILLCIGWEKKPKFAINLLIAVTVVSSSTYILNTLNSFISTDVREGILGTTDGSQGVVYELVGSNIHDLVYLDKAVGLANLNKGKNGAKTYEKFTKEMYDAIDITDTVDPDEATTDAGTEILGQGIEMVFDKNKVIYSVLGLYDGVAWTDLLNEYYYRYTVDWWSMWLELISLIIVYLFMSYRVVRTLFEVVVHRLLAVLYSANLNNNQKVLKILDSLKDSYILLILVTVMIKLYLLASKFVNSMDVGGLSKGIILLFLAFAVIDGPNLIQKLTGTDVGASEGLSKMFTMMYGWSMMRGTIGGMFRTAKHGAGAAKNGAAKFFGGGSGSGSGEMGVPPETGDGPGGTATMENNSHNQQENNQDNRQNMSQYNSQNHQADLNGGSDGKTDIESREMSEGIAKDNLAGQEFSSEQNPDKNAGSVPAEKPSMDTGRETQRDISTGGSVGDTDRQASSRMDGIGKNMPDKQDALNGFNPGRDIGDRGLNNMEKMDRDIAVGTGMEKNIPDIPSAPIQPGGTILKEPERKSRQTLDRKGDKL